MVGLFLLSIAGTSIDMRSRSILGFFAALTLAFGGFWYSTLQPIITTQYVEHRQGEATGVLSQLAQLVNFLAYPTSLLFSYMISSKEKPVYWPGICFALAGVYHAIAISMHVYTFGVKNACYLLRRNKNGDSHRSVPGGADVDVDINMTTTVADQQERERQMKLKLQATPGLYPAI